jgi:hypothetical protein
VTNSRITSCHAASRAQHSDPHPTPALSINLRAAPEVTRSRKSRETDFAHPTHTAAAQYIPSYRSTHPMSSLFSTRCAAPPAEKQTFPRIEAREGRSIRKPEYLLITPANSDRGILRHLTRFCRVAACGRWPPRARRSASSERRWTALRRPCGRLSGRRQTQNVR